jgi:hypothetical protein
LNRAIEDTQKFVRKLRQQYQRTVVKDVISMLEREGHITIHQECPGANTTAIRAVRNFINALGFKPLTRKGF